MALTAAAIWAIVTAMPWPTEPVARWTSLQAVGLELGEGGSGRSRAALGFGDLGVGAFAGLDSCTAINRLPGREWAPPVEGKGKSPAASSRPGSFRGRAEGGPAAIAAGDNTP